MWHLYFRSGYLYAPTRCARDFKYEIHEFIIVLLTFCICMRYIKTNHKNILIPLFGIWPPKYYYHTLQLTNNRTCEKHCNRCWFGNPLLFALPVVLLAGGCADQSTPRWWWYACDDHDDDDDDAIQCDVIPAPEPWYSHARWRTQSSRAPSIEDDEEGHLIYHVGDVLLNRCSWILLLSHYHTHIINYLRNKRIKIFLFYRLIINKRANTVIFSVLLCTKYHREKARNCDAAWGVGCWSRVRFLASFR